MGDCKHGGKLGIPCLRPPFQAAPSPIASRGRCSASQCLQGALFPLPVPPGGAAPPPCASRRRCSPSLCLQGALLYLLVPPGGAAPPPWECVCVCMGVPSCPGWSDPTPPCAQKTGVGVGVGGDWNPWCFRKDGAFGLTDTALQQPGPRVAACLHPSVLLQGWAGQPIWMVLLSDKVTGLLMWGHPLPSPGAQGSEIPHQWPLKPPSPPPPISQPAFPLGNSMGRRGPLTLGAEAPRVLSRCP